MEDNFQTWLKEEIPRENVFLAILYSSVFLFLLYNIVFLVKFLFFGSAEFMLFFDRGQLPGLLMQTAIMAFPEELIFRFFLITVVGSYFGIARDLRYLVLCSIVFGFLHPGFWVGIYISIIGFVFNIFYIKCGGLSERCVEATLSVTILHTFYNFYVYLIYLFGYF